jgi:hypothetical protein
VETQKDIESLCVSVIDNGFTGKPCLRLNIHTYGKSLRPRPEFPIEKAPEIIEAIAELLIKNWRVKSSQ